MKVKGMLLSAVLFTAGNAVVLGQKSVALVPESVDLGQESVSFGKESSDRFVSGSGLSSGIQAGANESADDFSVVVPPFGNNWYVQVGMDMSLQNPYGHDFSNVFPNGKSFGLDVAMGKWFTPGLGLRGKVNWENGFGLIGNGHANWLAPFYEPGKNVDKGGYVYLVGDIQFDLNNLLRGYNADRKWSVQAFPRAGLAYNFGVSKGTPLLGIGVGGVYKMSDKLWLYGDVAYNMVSSGFTGHSTTSTGTGSNSNGFFEINVGVQFNLGKSGFEKAKKSAGSSDGMGKNSGSQAVDADGRAVTGSFWNDIYVQAGLDMSLQNPYGFNFAETFPKGKTFGFAGAVGKWFSPEVGLRLRAKWENGFKPFENKHLEWMGPFGTPNTNMEKGGYVELSCDVQLSLHNIICGYDNSRKWNAIVFPRCGLVSNRATKSGSPMVGAGTGVTYRLSDKWSLYGDMAYQMSTSEFFDGQSCTGMSVSTGSNGFFDFHVGVQYDLTRRK